MLQQCLAKTPLLYNWMSWCYEAPCALYCQGQLAATSSCGVHQGDAMGPVGFALGLEHALDACRPLEGDITWLSWYLDDGTIVGPLDSVARYMEALQPALLQIGLQVNLTKCSLWGPGAHHEDDMNDLVSEALPLGHPCHHIPIVPYGPSTGITVLGVPCDAKNSTTHSDAHWESTVRKTSDTLRKFRELPDGQLRHCLL